MISMKKGFAKSVIAYFPVFSFTLAYIIYQYITSAVAITITPLQILNTIIIIFIFQVGFCFIAKKVIKDNTKAGLAVLLTSALWFFSEKFFIFSLIISGFFVLIWAGILLFRKKKISLVNITFVLAVLGLEFTIGLLVKSVQLNLPLNQIPEMRQTSTSSLIVPIDPPDIYYIVLDGYVRPDVLEELYGFDNSDFINYLLDKNFIVPEKNHSNYMKSILSIGSTLNMQYIQTLFPNVKDFPFEWVMVPAIKNNQVKAMLEKSGYKSVAVFGDWELTNIDNADIYLEPLPIQINNFEKLLLQSSPLRIFSSVIEKYVLLRSYPSHRKSVNFAFKALSEIPDFDDPKFVFAHIISPHPPFVFDKDGQPVEPSYNFSFTDAKYFPGSNEQYINGYVNQLQYINQELENAIDSILDKSYTPPIIIILSDHGSRMLTDFSSSANSCIRECFSNFAAFYLPDLDEDVIPSDITSVNVFRLIFDHYFGTEFGILDNRYYFTDIEYSFEDVASRINTVCDVSH